MLIRDRNAGGSNIFIQEKMVPCIEPLDVIVGVDAGSTQTRVCIADALDADVLLSTDITEAMYTKLKDSVYIIPSTYANAGDQREIKPYSDNLEHNYDSRIGRISTAAVNPMVNSERIVRGQKILDAAGLVALYLDSSSDKARSPIFYINVLDCIGYGLMQKYNGAIPEKVRIHLVVSVRPKELNRHCQQQMDDNFIGEYFFAWKKVKIMMNIVETIYTTEPEAQIAGTDAVMSFASVACNDEHAAGLSDKFSQSDSYMHIEGGGSSVGVEVVKNGNIVAACSSTLQLGGNFLIKTIMGQIREQKGRIVSEESVASALQTCLLRNGREREDISDIIADCKNQVGRAIVESVRHDVIDITPDLSLLDMDFVSLGGRLFRKDDSGNSIGEYFASYLKQLSPNTEVIVLQDNYIPQGNMITGFSEFDNLNPVTAREIAKRITPVETVMGQATAEEARAASEEAEENYAASEE